MSPTVHSPWGASSSKRRAACPGSFALEQRASNGQRRSSVYAAEGTFAHSINEDCLLPYLAGVIPAPEDPMARLHEEATVDGHLVKVDIEMAAACRRYVDFVAGLVCDGYAVTLEKQVSLDTLFKPDPPPVPLFGTADCVAYHEDKRHLVMGDFKYGRGVPVEVEENSQLLYYTVGCILDLGYSPRTVELVVVQPRAPHADGPIRRVTYDALDVLSWAYDTLRPAIEASIKPDAPLVPGDHCRFCAAIHVCPAIHERAQQAARDAFGPVTLPKPVEPRKEGVPPEPHELSDDELGELLDKAVLFEAWLDSLRVEAQERLSSGKRVPGFKLVKKKANRRWADEDALVAALAKANIASDVYSEMKVRTPAQLEKALGKRDFNAVAAGFIEVPDTGVTMVRDSDPRPAVPGRLQPADVFGTTQDDT